MTKKIPMRTCIGCKENKPKKELIRFVRTPEHGIIMDVSGKANGRGAYICPDISCFSKAKSKKALAKALAMTVDSAKMDELEQALGKYLKLRVKD